MLLLIHISGGNAGHQQHLRAFVAKFLPVLFNTVRESISDDVKKRPFGITADKITTLRRTRHIFGIRISQLNNMGSEICAEDVYVSHSVVKDTTSQGLACHILDCLEMFGISRIQTRENLIGMAFDGQYINMGVDKEICRELNIEKVMPSTWDPMHLLEKSQDDSETPFVEKTCETINAVMKDLKWGKSLEILLSYKELVETFYSPKIFKDMKFVSHAESVFKTFASDFKAIVSSFKTQSNDLLGKILEPGFIFNFLFLRDIITKISRLSKDFQISNQLPYEYPRTYRAFMCGLEQYIILTQAFENFITVISSMSNIELFEGLDTKKKNYTQFPDMRFLPDATFPDFGKFSNDEDNIIQHLVVHACQILNKSSSFHNELKLLVIDKIFMGCNLIVTLQRTSRFIVKWTSNSNTLKAIGKSLNGFLKYLKGLNQIYSNV